MTLVHTPPRTEQDLYCHAYSQLKEDAQRGLKESKRLFGRAWSRFAIVPEGIALRVQRGDVERPFESKLKLDRDGLINQTLLEEVIEGLASEGIFFGRLELLHGNPFIGIDDWYYETTFSVRGF